MKTECIVYQVNPELIEPGVDVSKLPRKQQKKINPKYYEEDTGFMNKSNSWIFMS